MLLHIVIFRTTCLNVKENDFARNFYLYMQKATMMENT